MVKDGNKLLDVVQEFEDWSGLRISTPKSLATGAMYGTGSERRSERAKTDTAKRRREAGPTGYPKSSNSIPRGHG